MSIRFWWVTHRCIFSSDQRIITAAGVEVGVCRLITRQPCMDSPGVNGVHRTFRDCNIEEHSELWHVNSWRVNAFSLSVILPFNVALPPSIFIPLSCSLFSFPLNPHLWLPTFRFIHPLPRVGNPRQISLSRGRGRRGPPPSCRTNACNCS